MTKKVLCLLIEKGNEINMKYFFYGTICSGSEIFNTQIMEILCCKTRSWSVCKCNFNQYESILV